jgi:hypothetical protein
VYYFGGYLLHALILTTLLHLQSGTTIVDQIDLLQEQVKMLAGDVALCTSSLKRLTEQAANNPDNLQIQANFLIVL